MTRFFTYEGELEQRFFHVTQCRRYLSNHSLLSLLLMSVLNVNEQKVGQSKPAESLEDVGKELLKNIHGNTFLEPGCATLHDPNTLQGPRTKITIFHTTNHFPHHLTLEHLTQLPPLPVVPLI